MSETWRAVPGFEDAYEVSDLGRVRSLERIVYAKTKLGDPLPRLHRGRVLGYAKHRGGYLLVHLWLDGERKAETVHALVMQAFVGPRPPGMDVAHNDGNRADCRLANLRYATRSDNLADKVRHGTQTWGEEHHASTLTKAQVYVIRSRQGATHEAIADEVGTTRGNVSRIRRRETWRHV